MNALFLESASRPSSSPVRSVPLTIKDIYLNKGPVSHIQQVRRRLLTGRGDADSLLVPVASQGDDFSNFAERGSIVDVPLDCSSDIDTDTFLSKSEIPGNAVVRRKAKGLESLNLIQSFLKQPKKKIIDQKWTNRTVPEPLFSYDSFSDLSLAGFYSRSHTARKALLDNNVVAEVRKVEAFANQLRRKHHMKLDVNETVSNDKRLILVPIRAIGGKVRRATKVREAREVARERQRTAAMTQRELMEERAAEAAVEASRRSRADAMRAAEHVAYAKRKEQRLLERNRLKHAKAVDASLQREKMRPQNHFALDQKGMVPGLEINWSAVKAMSPEQSIVTVIKLPQEPALASKASPDKDSWAKYYGCSGGSINYSSFGIKGISSKTQSRISSPNQQQRRGRLQDSSPNLATEYTRDDEP